MSKKIISGIGIGIAIISMIIIVQNIQIETDVTNTSITNLKMNQDCILEFSEEFPNENENVIKNLCDNSESVDELIPFIGSNNINSHGLSGQEFSLTKPIDTYRIILVGGSTMVGKESYSDQTTIPGILQKIFDKQELKTNMEVINAGVASANTITEFKLINERIIDFQPDLIIMYDGWNDLRSEYEADTIYNNWKSICEIGNKNNFDVIITLQPIPGFGNKDLTQQEYVNALTGKNHNDTEILLQKNQYEKYADKLKELSTVCTKTEDLRNAFDDVNGSIYWDNGHIVEAGNMIIAERLYKSLIPIIQNENLTNHITFNKILKKYNNPIVISYLLEQYGINMDDFKNQKLLDYTHDTKYFELKESVGIDNILVGKDLRDIDLSTINLTNQDLTGVNLSGQDLRNIDFTGTILRSVDFTNANLSGLDLTSKYLTGSIFDKTNLSETVLIQTDCKYCKISNTNFSDSVLMGSRLSFTTLDNNDFSNTRIIAVAFSGSTISNTDFKNSDLSFDKTGVLTDTFNLNELGITYDDLHTNFSETMSKLPNIIKQKKWGNSGASPQMLFTSFKFQDDEMIVYWNLITSFQDVEFNNVDFTGTDLTLARFDGSFGNADLINAKLNCVGDTICNDKTWFLHDDMNIGEMILTDSNDNVFHTNDEVRMYLKNQ